MRNKFFVATDNMTDIIKKYFPQQNQINLIKTGWTNFVYEVKTDGGNYFFRFPRNEFFADALEKEYAINQYVQDKISFQTNNLVLNYDNGRPFTFHRAIEGKSLQECYSELTFEQKCALAEDICKLFQEFYDIEVDSKFEKVSNFLDRLSLVSQNNYDLSYHDVFKNNEQKKLVFSHGDFNQGNLILKDNKLVAVIDFAFAGSSHPYTDLARIINRSPADFKPIMIAFYEQKFGRIKDLLVVGEMQKSYDYVDNQYIKYIKQYHPTICLQEENEKI